MKLWTLSQAISLLEKVHSLFDKNFQPICNCLNFFKLRYKKTSHKKFIKEDFPFVIDNFLKLSCDLFICCLKENCSISRLQGNNQILFEKTH